MGLYYTIKHGDATWTSSSPVDYVSLQNGSSTASIATTSTRTLNCGGKYMNNDLVIGAKTLHCTGKIMENNVIVTAVDELSIPLFFEAKEANSGVVLKKRGSPSIIDTAYSTDGINWINYNLDTPITLTNIGDRVYFRNTITGNFSSSNNIGFHLWGNLSASGNCNSMYNASNFVNINTLSYTYCFCGLFKPFFTEENTALTDAKNLKLPATTLSANCYEDMFDSCTSLASAPVLSATQLEDDCYNSMFSNCTALTTPPILPATTLYVRCYAGMFRSSGLTTAPTLPATIMKESCYSSMFYGCTSLTTPPALPATTLYKACYEAMFSYSSITRAPILPATTLAEWCYYGMFKGCTKLTIVPKLPSNYLIDKVVYQLMFQGCTSLQVWTSSGSGHDKAWTIPTTGTFISTESQSNMFKDCPGTRSTGDDFPGAEGASYTFYTQNAPV